MTTFKLLRLMGVLSDSFAQRAAFDQHRDQMAPMVGRGAHIGNG
jgi:hypothetical protein